MTDERGAVVWQPIETAPKDGTPMLRPHVTWGAMAVRYKRPDHDEAFLNGCDWMSADYSALWPEGAFLPFWTPCPDMPPRGDHMGGGPNGMS